MLRACLILVAATTALGAIPSPARAEIVCGLNPRGDYYLSLRTGPGAKNREMLRLAEGTYLEVLETRRGWFKVIANSSVVGWVSARYVCDG